MEEFIGYFPYWGIVLLLVLGGIGLPVSEDLTIILAGQLILSENLNIPLLFGVCFLGVISTDILLFYIGKKYGRVLFRYKYFRRIFTPQRRIQVRTYFDKFGEGLIFIARFIGGFRSPVFITAGTLRMSYTRFLFWDIFASLLSIPLFVLGSYFIGQKFEEVAHGLATKITLGIMGLMFLVFVGVLWHWHLETVKEKQGPKES